MSRALKQYTIYMFPLEFCGKTPNVYVGGARLDKAYRLYPGFGLTYDSDMSKH